MTRLGTAVLAIWIAILIGLAAALWTYATADDPACPPGQAQVYMPGGSVCRDVGQWRWQP
jgi:hypothetical protein